MFDFSAYLKFVCADRCVGDARSLYTATDALLSLEAQTVKRQKPGDAESAILLKPLPVLKQLRTYALGEKREHTLLAGRPGFGKSTTLKQIFLELVAAALTDDTQPIPVLVQLKSDRPILELICVELRRVKPRVTLDQIDDWLLEDKLVLLLDGINEIPSDGLRQKLQELRDDNPTTPMIFTTRDLAVGGDLGIEKRLEMRPLTELQMREFVQKYLPEYGEVLLRQLKDSLREVAETPLLLKMLCDVFDPNTQQIPQSKGELFQLFSKKYDNWKEREGVRTSEKFWKWNTELLQYLAFAMLQRNNSTESLYTICKDKAARLIEKYLTGRVADPGDKAKNWLADLIDYHLLQESADSRKIEFHHQLFQEYYAAETLLVMLQDNHPDVEDDRFQHFYLNYLKWTEAISIALSLMEDETQALQLVHLALEVDRMLGAKLVNQLNERCQHSVIQLIAAQLICNSLKVRLLGETRAKSAATELVALFEEVDFSDSSGRSDVLDALEQIGRVGVSLAICKAFDDPTLVGKAFLFLGKLESDESFQLLAGAVEHSDPGIRWGSAMALAEMNSEASIQVLFKAIKNSNFDVQISAAFALGTLGFEIAIPILKQAIDLTDSLDICKMAIFALAKIDSEQAVLIFRQLMQHPDFSDLAINVLMTMDLEAIAPRLHEIIYGVRHKFENKIAVILSSKDITDSLLERAVQDARPDVVESLAILLRKTGNFYPQMIDVLWKHQIKLYQKEVAETISAIQAKYQFYSYAIAQWKLAPHTTERSSSITIQGDYIAGDKIEGDKNLIDRVGNLNQGDVTIHGNQNGKTLNL